MAESSSATPHDTAKKSGFEGGASAEEDVSPSLIERRAPRVGVMSAPRKNSRKAAQECSPGLPRLSRNYSRQRETMRRCGGKRGHGAWDLLRGASPAGVFVSGHAGQLCPAGSPVPGDQGLCGQAGHGGVGLCAVRRRGRDRASGVRSVRNKIKVPEGRSMDRYHEEISFVPTGLWTAIDRFPEALGPLSTAPPGLLIVLNANCWATDKTRPAFPSAARCALQSGDGWKTNCQSSCPAAVE